MTTPVNEQSKPISKRRDWLPVAREALASYPARKFEAGVLREIIMHHLRPDIAPLLEQDRAAPASSFRWLRASQAWDAENPGLSDSSCRRLCNQLVAEGRLILGQERRGWYVQNWYRRVPVLAEAGEGQ